MRAGEELAEEGIRKRKEKGGEKTNGEEGSRKGKRRREEKMKGGMRENEGREGGEGRENSESKGGGRGKLIGSQVSAVLRARFIEKLFRDL